MARCFLRNLVILSKSQNSEKIHNSILELSKIEVKKGFLTLLSALTPRHLRPIRAANKTQTRDPLNFGPCKADWPSAFVIN